MIFIYCVQPHILNYRMDSTVALLLTAAGVVPHLIPSSLCCSYYLYPLHHFDCVIACNDRSENDPARYYDGYSKLRTWAYSYLDHYKVCYMRRL
jgi:hypothetical protein